MVASKSEVSPVPAEDFARAFSAVEPLIREEWPGLDASALEATGGDLEKVTALVATHADRTKALVRRQLDELYELGTRKAGKAHGAAPRPMEWKELLDAVKRLETLAAEEARKVSDDLLPRAEAKVKENIWMSLLLSLGLGMILGLWMATGRRRG